MPCELPQSIRDGGITFSKNNCNFKCISVFLFFFSPKSRGISVGCPPPLVPMHSFGPVVARMFSSQLLFSCCAYNVVENSRQHPEIRDFSRQHPEIRNFSREHPEVLNFSREYPEIRNFSREDPEVQF
jgi:hypothetical protein